MNIKNTYKNFSSTIPSKDSFFIREINSMKNDIEKIIEREKIRKDPNSYIIIDKKNSRADIYNRGEIVDRFEVGVGETYGDDLNTATYYNGDFSKEGRTTPPGQYQTKSPYDFNIKNKADYEEGKIINCLLLDGIHHPVDFKQRTILALHQISKTHPERMEMFDKTNVRRSMSSGCINFIPEDFYRLTEKINPNKTPVYILPEENGNTLELISLPNGLWFKPKYANEQKENTFILAMKKFFNL